MNRRILEFKVPMSYVLWKADISQRLIQSCYSKLYWHSMPFCTEILGWYLSYFSCFLALWGNKKYLEKDSDLPPRKFFFWRGGGWFFSVFNGIHFAYHSLHLVKLYLFKLSTAFTFSVDGTSYVLCLFKLWEACVCVCVCVCVLRKNCVTGFRRNMITW